MATHMMSAMALKPDELVSSTDLAESMNTNPVVVRRILSELQSVGLLTTQAGRCGGAQLAKKPNLITLFDIYAAVDDGELFAYNPNDPNRACALSCEMKSVLEPVFAVAKEALAESLKKIRLSDVVDRLAKKCSAKRSHP